MMALMRNLMTHAANVLSAPERKATEAQQPKAAALDADAVRRLQLAASGRSGINLADLSPEEIDARLFG